MIAKNNKYQKEWHNATKHLKLYKTKFKLIFCSGRAWHHPSPVCGALPTNL
jgi:hypothetical protein